MIYFTGKVKSRRPPWAVSPRKRHGTSDTKSGTAINK